MAGPMGVRAAEGFLGGRAASLGTAGWRGPLVELMDKGGGLGKGVGKFRAEMLWQGSDPELVEAIGGE